MDAGNFGRHDLLRAMGSDLHQQSHQKVWNDDDDRDRKRPGTLTMELYEVQQDSSLWSAVFEPSAKRITYYFRKANPMEGITEPEHTGDPNDEEFQNSPYYDEYMEYLNEFYDAKRHPIDYATPVVVQF